jgi:hypothetical protein
MCEALASPAPDWPVSSMGSDSIDLMTCPRFTTIRFLVELGLIVIVAVAAHRFQRVPCSPALNTGVLRCHYSAYVE